MMVGGVGGKCDVMLVCVGDLGDLYGDGLLWLVWKKLWCDYGFVGGKGN